MAAAPSQPEYWLRGPVDGVDPVLMPAAHAFLQTLEDAENAVSDLTIDEVWASPGGISTIGFHLRHLCGATDRLLTYARGVRLNDAQKAALAAENDPPRQEVGPMLADLRAAIDAALMQIRSTTPPAVYETRSVGRAALPTTVLGLIFHAAEHSQRHAGQLVTTAKIIRASRSAAPSQ